MTQRPRRFWMPMRTCPLSRHRPGHSRSARPSTPPTMMFGRRRRPSWPKLSIRAVGGHKQGQNIETIGTVVRNNFGSRNGRAANEVEGLRGIPRMAGDERLAVRINRAFKAQQTMVRAGGNDATIWAEHQDFAVAIEAEFVDG